MISAAVNKALLVRAPASAAEGTRTWTLQCKRALQAQGGENRCNGSRVWHKDAVAHVFSCSSSIEGFPVECGHTGSYIRVMQRVYRQSLRR